MTTIKNEIMWLSIDDINNDLTFEFREMKDEVFPIEKIMNTISV